MITIMSLNRQNFWQKLKSKRALWSQLLLSVLKLTESTWQKSFYFLSQHIFFVLFTFNSCSKWKISAICPQTPTNHCLVHMFVFYVSYLGVQKNLYDLNFQWFWYPFKNFQKKKMLIDIFPIIDSAACLRKDGEQKLDNANSTHLVLAWENQHYNKLMLFLFEKGHFLKFCEFNLS